jgi:hypothetical protein
MTPGRAAPSLVLADRWLPGWAAALTWLPGWATGARR